MTDTEQSHQPAVRIDRLTKTYKLYGSPRQRLKEAFHPRGKRYHRPFDALHDISLEIAPATTVGIVGRNGSGKSTLLQCICGIVPPTAGSVTVNGRIAALLELGAGFNPEFSGRDNLYINAGILGLTREQTEQRLDEILAFADIGDFIDQPVRAYSSGMYVRLAFSIAIHVDPDILIVDEALAVGDVHFQARCYDRFHAFREQGVTVIFVTHDLNMVTRYCDHAYLLDKGSIALEGEPRPVVAAYRKLASGHSLERETDSAKGSTDTLRSASTTPDLLESNPYETRYGNKKATIVGGGINGSDGQPGQVLHSGEECAVWVNVKFEQDVEDPVFAFTIKDVRGTAIAGTNTDFSSVATGAWQAGETAKIHFTQRLMLNAGDYLLSLGCVSLKGGELEIYDRRHHYFSFQVVSDKSIVGVVDLESAINISRSTE